jgi:outer membrane protein assembly factor BamB
MTESETRNSTRRPPLRLWPGVLLVALQWFAWLAIPILVPTTEGGYGSVLGAAGCGLLIVLWWLLFSRAAWVERLGAVVLMVVGIVVTRPLLHESVATVGQSMMFYFYAIPVLTLAFVAWAVMTRNLPDRTRRWTMAATILVSCLGWALVRTGGGAGAGAHFAWRWSATPEERLLAGEDRPAGGGAELAASEPEWPGFRGPHRDGRVPGVRIATDWDASPPEEIWRRPVGPGWSSFAVHGDLIYTQEQRGENEVVACYDATTGEPVWRHGDKARFWESNGGAGPRGTPTLSDGRVYSFGATGILNVLDAADGSLYWSRDVGADTGIEVPYWGFSSSPVVIGDLVIVAAVGKLAAYDLESGEPRWFGPEGGSGYSSPHLLTIDGVPQVLMLSGTGAVSVAPDDGRVLWEHEWDGYPITQPAVAPDGDILINAGQQGGVRRLTVSSGGGVWTVEEHWTSTGLKPYFNDFVVHEGHAFGFDGNILATIDLSDGARKWKGGRYGQGQLVLLPEQDLLLVISEKGQLALVSATAGGYRELARFAAIEGKTWNHPVLVGDLLLVRNDQEMAAFRLAAAGG